MVLWMGDNIWIEDRRYAMMMYEFYKKLQER